jgi:predicted acylesterase/phospholipase RssA
MKDFEIDCKISVVTIIGGRRILLDRESHPTLPVWKAVRMSSTIPFIFPYLELDGAPVTDGGLTVRLFDIFPNSPRPIIGLRPRADHGLKKMAYEVKTHKLFIWNYLKILAEYFLDALDNQHVPAPEWHRTIVIPTQEIGGFDFYLTPPDVERLIQCGYDAVMSTDLALLK